MRDPNAVVYLIPGVGMITFAKDKATARISGEFYVNAINVMRGASGVSTYVGLPEQEAFDIEYWLLEEAKLQRMPKPKMLAGKIALVTGGAGGIGKATANRLMQEGACVVLADIDETALASALDELGGRYGKDFVRAVNMNVTDEAAVEKSFADTLLEFGGLDILVSNAGLASSAVIEDTTLALWNKNINILTTGYFLVSREAFRIFRQQQSRRQRRLRRFQERCLPPPPAHPPIARQRLPRSTLPAAWRSKARPPRSASTSSIRMPCCAAPRSGPASGRNSAPPFTRRIWKDWRRCTANAPC